jgi:hypothetical protein
MRYGKPRGGVTAFGNAACAVLKFIRNHIVVFAQSTISILVYDQAGICCNISIDQKAALGHNPLFHETA